MRSGDIWEANIYILKNRGLSLESLVYSEEPKSLK